MTTAMINYRALFSFTSDNGNYYFKDDLLSQAEFENLPNHEQDYFTSAYIEPAKI